ncbi:MAG: T9SS type A sorting domain-containing protein [candidate division WOR-3 bacterium]
MGYLLMGFMILAASRGHETKVGQTIVWSFETGWQDWTHTSSYQFPNAWGIASSNLYPGWRPPDAQDFCLWFDDASAGPGAPVLKDTALSPLIVPDSTTTWLKWGVTYNFFGGAERLEMGIKYFDDSTWRVVPLRIYTSDVLGQWDSADVSAYKIYPKIQVYVYYDDGGGWQWYGAIDNVTINGMLYIPDHDVGTIAILQPPENLLPHTIYHPTAIFKNFGGNQEVFQGHFQIDSSGIVIYHRIQNVTLNPGADTTITFDEWRSGVNVGMSYLFKAFTVLTSDMNPLNDTLVKTGIVNQTFWEILPAQFPQPSSGHSLATLHNGRYMVFGLNTSAGYTHQTWIYEINSDQWIAGPINPYGCGAYGTAQGVRGKYYRIGGTDSWPTPIARVEIYDPVSSQWTRGADCPMANIDMVSGVYKDSLIFTFGGGNWGGIVLPHTNVYFYDTYLDNWSQATNIPGPGRGCAAGGIIDTFAIVACGYDGSAVYRNDYIVGRINPNNCAQINWSTPALIPGMVGRYRVPSGIDRINKELWLVCGQITGGTSDEIWSYNPYTNTWTNWNRPKPHPVGNVSPIVVTLTALGDLGIFIASGYLGGTLISEHEVFHTGYSPGIEENFSLEKNPSKVLIKLPNPTGAHVPITYTTTKTGTVTLHIYDVTGRLVRRLVNRVHEPAGAKTVYWDGEDDHKRCVPGGIYFIKLEAENRVISKKFVLIR